MYRENESMEHCVDVSWIRADFVTGSTSMYGRYWERGQPLRLDWIQVRELWLQPPDHYPRVFLPVRGVPAQPLQTLTTFLRVTNRRGIYPWNISIPPSAYMEFNISLLVYSRRFLLIISVYKSVIRSAVTIAKEKTSD